MPWLYGTIKSVTDSSGQAGGPIFLSRPLSFETHQHTGYVIGPYAHTGVPGVFLLVEERQVGR
jgi:hypothetical protein